MMNSKTDVELILFLSKRGKKTEIPLSLTDLSFHSIYCQGKSINAIVAFIRLLLGLIRHGRANVLTDTPDRIGFLALIAAKIMKRKLILRARGDSIYESQLKKRYIRNYINKKILYPSLTGVVTCADYLKYRLLKQFPKANEEKIITIPTPILEISSIDQYKVYTSSIQRETKQKQILIVTNYNFYEKVAPLIPFGRILLHLVEERPELNVLICGGGKFRKSIEDYYKSYYRNARINFTEFKNDISQQYLNSYCCVYISGLDAYPSVINEARFFGLPVISINRFGITEMINDGIDGFFVNDDYSNLMELIDSLDNSILYQRIAKSGFERVLRDNNPYKIGFLLKNTYQKMISFDNRLYF